MKKSFFVFIFSCYSLFACEITPGVNLLIINEKDSNKDYLHALNCDEKYLQNIHESITSLDGKIASFQFEEMLKSKGLNIFVNTRTFQVQQLKSLLRQQIPMPKNTIIKSISSIKSKGVIEISNGDQVELACQSCLFESKQPLNITIKKFDGSQLEFSSVAEYANVIHGYRTTTNITSFSSFDDTSNLEEVMIEQIPQTTLVTNLDLLKFYKTNKALKAGDLIKFSDLNPVNLVRAGLKTEVILENSLIRIKTQGISRGNASIGEFVEIFHPQKNKLYQGKAVDINKVLVEL